MGARIDRHVPSGRRLRNYSTMGPVGPLEIPANGSVTLAPGGLHVMLMKLQQPLTKGGQFSMTLIFKNAGRVDVSVPIYSVGASGPEQ